MRQCVLAKAWLEKGSAVDPIAAYLLSGYRGKVAQEDPSVSGAGGRIV